MLYFITRLIVVQCLFWRSFCDKRSIPSALNRLNTVQSWINSVGSPLQQYFDTTWLKHPIPDWWLINSCDQLSNLTMLSSGSRKDVLSGTFLNLKHDLLVDVVVKVLKVNQRKGRRPQVLGSEVHREILYLEYLRGKSGIPFLYGGWVDNGGLFYVVENAGSPLGEGQGTAAAPTKISNNFKHAAFNHPYQVTIALLSLFESFSENGGCFLQDFLPRQFTYRHRPVNERSSLSSSPLVELATSSHQIYLIDGPIPLKGPLGKIFRQYNGGRITKLSNNNHSTCNANVDCPSTERLWHCCCEVPQQPTTCELGSQGSRESNGYCNLQKKKCESITSKTHVFDVAGKVWLLPAIINAASKNLKNLNAVNAAKNLQSLIPKMTHSDQMQRPSFAVLLGIVREWVRINDVSS